MVLLLLHSCHKDLGNYDYKEINEIEISDIPDQINVLSNVDTLVIKPKVVSKTEGEIASNNEHYQFTYAISGELETGEMNYHAIDSTYPKDLNYVIKLEPKVYDINFIVTDKRTGVQTLKPFKLNVTSAVTEGWMVLSNEGPNQRVRLDMLSVISPTRTVQATDLGNLIGLPPITKGHTLSYVYSNFITAKISILTASDGCYNLNHKDLLTGPANHMKFEFGNVNANGMPQVMQRTATNYYLTVDGIGDAYSQYYNVAGPIFEFPVNNTQGDKKSAFKVSRFIVADPKPSGGSNSIIGYDISNKRFVDWSSGRRDRMLPMENPTDKLFDYATGKNLVVMDASLYGNSTAYAILEKDGAYSLYGMRFIRANPVGRFEQSNYDVLTAPEIANATTFAFHSTLPYMFYAAGSKLYQYDIVTKQTKLMKDFGAQVITKLKFNIFKFTIRNRPKEYYDQQYDLIVALNDDKLPANASATLQFYSVPPLNADLTLIKEYKGFAKIADVTYKEAPTF